MDREPMRLNDFMVGDSARASSITIPCVHYGTIALLLHHDANNRSKLQEFLIMSTSSNYTELFLITQTQLSASCSFNCFLFVFINFRK